MDLRWLVDPEVGRQNPRRTRIGLVAAGVVAGTVVGFLRLADHDPWKTLLAAMIGGLAGVVISFRVLGPEPTPRTHVLEVGFTVMGIVVAILGIVVDDVRVVLSALPLWLIAAAVFVAKRHTARKQ